MKKTIKSIISTWLLITFWYIWVTADYTWLTKNTWDTLTAASWNQLVDNVRWIWETGNWKVWIWTDTPSNAQWWGTVLDVRGTANSKILATESNQWVKTGVFSHYTWSGTPTWTIWTESNHDLRFVTNYAEKMRLTKGGNFWIWTNNPTEKLHLAWDSVNLLLDWTWNAWTPMTSISMRRGASSYTFRSWIGGHSDFDIYDDSANESRIFIKSTWNVWIWTTSPDSDLEIRSEDISQSSHLSVYRNSDNYASTLSLKRSNGSKASPTAVNYAQTVWAITFDSYDWSDYQRIGMINSKLTSTWGGGSIQFYTTDSTGSLNPNLMIHESGNIWIWTTSPEADLHVSWNIKVEDSGVACSSTTEWQVRYDSTSKKHQWCNGTSWNDLY